MILSNFSIGKLSVLWIFVCCLISSQASAESNLRKTSAPTPLDDYVAAPDPAFHWEIKQRHKTPLGTILRVELVSQTWRNSAEVDRTEWKHWLLISIPQDAKADRALIVISGGENSANPPPMDERFVQISLATHSVVAELRTVPNQPLVFAGDGEQRVEDNILAYSWTKYLETHDPTWIAQLAMVKSAVRGMDAIQQVIEQEKISPPVKGFVVAGGSKRGWTTWLTAAVDNRVVAIAPLVIDVLHIAKSMPHHRAVYGFWAPALDDYVRQGLPDRLDDPDTEELLSIVDPYVYRDRLTMPKCLIHSSGDEFFLPDSSRFYFDQLVGEKHLCYVPNTGHSLKESTAMDTLVSFYDAILNDRQRPEITWQETEPGTWSITTDTPPQQVLLWRAENPTARDFRVDTVGKSYRPQQLQPSSPGKYEVKLAAPPNGWSASFVEFTYSTGAPRPLRFTTPVWIVPDNVPPQP